MSALPTKPRDQAAPAPVSRRSLSPLALLRRRVRRILKGLARLYPDARCALD